MPLPTDVSGSREVTIVPFERTERARVPRIESILILLERANDGTTTVASFPASRNGRRPRRRPPVSCCIHPFTTEPPPDAA